VNSIEEQAMLDMFSILDAVFSESDCFEPGKRVIGFGQLYRSWKRTRRVFARTSLVPVSQRLLTRLRRWRSLSPDVWLYGGRGLMGLRVHLRRRPPDHRICGRLPTRSPCQIDAG
jgi:hypothetical protein